MQICDGDALYAVEGTLSSPELGSKVQADGRDVPVDRAVVVVEAAFTKRLNFGVLVIVCFAEQGRCAGHLGLLAEAGEAG